MALCLEYGVKLLCIGVQNEGGYWGPMVWFIEGIVGSWRVRALLVRGFIKYSFRLGLS